MSDLFIIIACALLASVGLAISISSFMRALSDYLISDTKLLWRIILVALNGTCWILTVGLAMLKAYQIFID